MINSYFTLIKSLNRFIYLLQFGCENDDIHEKVIDFIKKRPLLKEKFFVDEKFNGNANSMEKV